MRRLSSSRVEATMIGRLGALVRRVPFTSAVVLVMIVAALATGTLWFAAEDRSWYPAIAYGVPSLAAGRWWTLLTGPFFAVVPTFYLAMTGSFALLVGITEWRLGTRIAAVTAVVGQLSGILAALGFLLLVRGHGWTWADATSGLLDVGFSAGALASVAVLSATLRPPWRLRLRLALALYVLASAVYLGTLADLEHLVAVGLALAVGPRLIRGRLGLVRPGRPSRREWRLLAVFLLVLMTVGGVLAFLLPGDGPLGPTGDPQTTGIDVAIDVVVTALLVNGLRRGHRVAWRWAVAWSGLNVLLGLLVIAAALLAEVVDGVAVVDLPGLFAAQRLAWTVLFVLLVVGRRAWRVPSRRRRRAADGVADRETATTLLERHGGGSLSWTATWPDNDWFGTADGGAVVAWQRHAGVAIGLGDPVAAADARLAALAEFGARSETAGLVACLFQASDAMAAEARAAGWRTAQVAEDTLIDLPGPELRGAGWQDVRPALDRAAAQGITFRLVTLDREPNSLVAQVREVCEQAVGPPDPGFTLGGIDEALDPHVRVGLAVDADGTVHGVTSWLPVYAPGGTVTGWRLDVVRRREGGFPPVVEFLVGSACVAFRDEGATVLSLSGAPLAHTDTSGDTAVLDRVLAALGARLERTYGFRSLHTFTAGFQPRYVPLHLVYRDEADLPRIGLALARAYLPEASARELVRVARA